MVKLIAGALFLLMLGAIIGLSIEVSKLNKDIPTGTVTKPISTECVGAEIAVFGHRSPDTDAVSSAIIYAWELHNPTPTSTNTHSLCAVPYVNSDAPNKETLFVLDYFGVDVPEIITSVDSNTIFATVDTNNIDEMPDGAAAVVSDNIHSIVDHHKLTGLVTTDPLVADLRNIGSAGSVLYHRSREVNRIIPGVNDPNGNINIAGLMLATILSDTLNLQSPTTTQKDRDAVNYLAPLAGVDDTDALFDQMISAKSDVSDYSALELMTLDSKVYPFADPSGTDFKLRISVLENGKPEDVLTRSNELEQACAEQLATDQQENPTQRGVLFYVIDIINETATYVPCDGSSKEYSRELVLQGEYPNTNGAPKELENGQIFIDGVVSRKLQLIPGLTVSTAIVPYNN
ncbi:MAG: hypothetical protein SGARI_001165 [Bacillariaceae sp.]